MQRLISHYHIGIITLQDTVLSERERENSDNREAKQAHKSRYLLCASGKI